MPQDDGGDGDKPNAMGVEARRVEVERGDTGVLCVFRFPFCPRDHGRRKQRTGRQGNEREEREREGR